MKVILNAGGKGTRGWPLTTYIPKSMLPVSGKPLAEHIVNYLDTFEEISEVIFIVDDSELGEQIPNFFDGKQSKYRVKLTFRKDRQDDTGGAILQCQDDLKDEKDFMLWYSDNLCNLDVDQMIKQFRASDCTGCIATRRKKQEETGFVKIRDDNRIISFVEKPISDLELPEALGIYAFKTEILKDIKKVNETKQKINLSFDIIQNLPELSMLSYDIGDSVWLDLESQNKIVRNKKSIDAILSSINA